MKTDIQKTLNLTKIITNGQGGAHPTTMININKALIKSKIEYAYIITDERHKQIHKTCQTIKNRGIRTCLGLITTTPIPALLSEATEMTTELDNRKKTVNYITRHLYRNTKIAKDIKAQKSTHKLNQTYNKYPILSQIIPTHYKKTNPNNLIIFPYIKGLSNKQGHNTTELNQITKQTIATYIEQEHIYTDGSITGDTAGIGIYITESNRKLAIKLKNKTNIKTVETIAIKIAATLAQLSRKQKITIFTDSQSACKSIQTALTRNTKKHYENQIIDIAGHNKTKTITIQWIPGHINITGNDTADALAKSTTSTYTHTLDNNPTKSDTYKKINNDIKDEWTEIYQQMTNDTGRYYAQINPIPLSSTWFQHSNLSSQDIRTMTRLRTGHAYNKKYKAITKQEDSPNCSNCDTTEDNDHIITNCTNFNNIRNKYQILRQKTLQEILRRQDEGEYKMVLNFLKEIGYKL